MVGHVALDSMGRLLFSIDQWIQGGIEKRVAKRKIHAKNDNLQEYISLADSDDETKETNPERSQKGGRLRHEE